MVNNTLVFRVHLAGEQNVFGDSYNKISLCVFLNSACLVERFDENRKLATGENMQLIISCFTACIHIFASSQSQYPKNSLSCYLPR